MVELRNNYFFGLLILTVASCIIISGCVGETNFAGNTILKETNPVSDADEPRKIELFHFHGTRQCYSCKTLGAYAEETVKTYFPDELKSGKIVFNHINVDLPENKETTVKYGAIGSSLWIGVYRKDGSFSKEENIKVWYELEDEQNFMNYLKQVLDQKFGRN